MVLSRLFFVYPFRIGSAAIETALIATLAPQIGLRKMLLHQEFCVVHGAMGFGIASVPAASSSR